MWLQTVEPLPHKDLYKLSADNIGNFDAKDIVRVLRNGIVLTEALAAIEPEHFHNALNIMNVYSTDKL